MKSKFTENLSRKEYQMLAYYVGSGSRAETCREFGITPTELTAWLKMPQIRTAKRALKKSMLQTRRRELDRLEGKAFDVLNRLTEDTAKEESQIKATKIIMDEKRLRNQESDLADVVEALEEAVEAAAGRWERVETIDD